MKHTFKAMALALGLMVFLYGCSPLELLQIPYEAGDKVGMAIGKRTKNKFTIQTLSLNNGGKTQSFAFEYIDCKDSKGADCDGRASLIGLGPIGPFPWPPCKTGNCPPVNLKYKLVGNPPDFLKAGWTQTQNIGPAFKGYQQVRTLSFDGKDLTMTMDFQQVRK